MPDAGARGPSRTVAVLAGGLVFASAIAATRPLQVGSLLVVLVAATAITSAGLLRRGRDGSSGSPGVTARRQAAAWPWLAVFLVLCGWELTMFLAGNNPAWPTLSILSDSLLDSAPWRFVAGLGWYGGGVWLVSRCLR